MIPRMAFRAASSPVVWWATIGIYHGLVFALLALLFIGFTMAEIYVIIQVGSILGGWETIGLMILISLVGAWMVKREGLSLIRRVQAQLGAGSLPTKELVDGLLVAVAGALMLTPGFITDGIGLLFLMPPTRAIVRTWLIHRFRNRVHVSTMGFGSTVHDVGEAGYRRPDDVPPEPPIELGP